MYKAMLLSLSLLAGPAFADSVKGFCERDGKRLEFSDGLAFVDARDAEGVVTTTIYLTVKPIDRKALAACTDCSGAPGEDTFGSPRGNFIEAPAKLQADIRMAPAPLMGDKRVGPCYVGMGAWIPAKSKNKDAAWFEAKGWARRRTSISASSMVVSVIGLEPW